MRNLLLNVVLISFLLSPAFGADQNVDMLNKSGKEINVYSKKVVNVDVGDTKSVYSQLLDGHDYDDIQIQIANTIIQNLGTQKKDLVIYKGALFQPPRSLKKQMSDASLEFYYLIH